MQALDLVGHLVIYGEECHRPVTNLRLQALLYRIQQEYTFRYNKEAFSDKTVYSKDGIPYYPEVYYHYAYSQCDPIINIPVNPNVNDLLSECIKDIVILYSKTPTWKMINQILQEEEKEKENDK